MLIHKHVKVCYYPTDQLISTDPNKYSLFGIDSFTTNFLKINTSFKNARNDNNKALI